MQRDVRPDKARDIDASMNFTNCALIQLHAWQGGSSPWPEQSPSMKRIYDPVHHFIELTSAEARLLDSAVMQRLRRLVRAALLLHDIGHGPFSHACEAVLGVRHEDRTRALLGLPEMQSQLSALDVDPQHVHDLILGSPQTPYPVLAEIVSGPNLDADRMDYLMRDAYFTGV